MGKKSEMSSRVLITKLHSSVLVDRAELKLTVAGLLYDLLFALYASFILLTRLMLTLNEAIFECYLISQDFNTCVCRSVCTLIHERLQRTQTPRFTHLLISTPTQNGRDRYAMYSVRRHQHTTASIECY